MGAASAILLHDLQGRDVGVLERVVRRLEFRRPNEKSPKREVIGLCQLPRIAAAVLSMSELVMM
jgi:hypothetical protein